MSDLISRQAAIKAIEDLQNCYNGFSDTYDKACIIGVIEEVPPIEAEPVKHGRWIKSKKSDYNWECSNCGYGLTDYRTTYCYDCGARMDENGEDPSHPFAESVMMGMDGGEND